MGLGYREMACLYSETDPCWYGCTSKKCPRYTEYEADEEYEINEDEEE